MLNLFWNFLQILALVTLLAIGITSCSDQEASDTTASSTSSDNQTTSSETTTQVCSDELGADAVTDDRLRFDVLEGDTLPSAVEDTRLMREWAVENFRFAAGDADASSSSDIASSFRLFFGRGM